VNRLEAVGHDRVGVEVDHQVRELMGPEVQVMVRLVEPREAGQGGQPGQGEARNVVAHPVAAVGRLAIPDLAEPVERHEPDELGWIVGQWRHSSKFLDEDLPVGLRPRDEAAGDLALEAIALGSVILSVPAASDRGEAARRRPGSRR
jgi:hypothetical protein